MKKIVLFISLCSIISSCSINNSVVKNTSNLKKIELGAEIKDVVMEYRKNSDVDSIVILLTFNHALKSKNNTYFIKRIGNISNIYYSHISYYSIVDNIPVIISSKKDGFIHPKYYSKKFISYLTFFNINDDMLQYSITKYNNEDNLYQGDQVFESVIDHSDTWQVKNGRKYMKGIRAPSNTNFDVSLIKYMRVVEGSKDDRTKDPN